MKKCIICGDEAKYCIKDSNECYCYECGTEAFADLSYLQSIETQAQNLKAFIKEKMREQDE